MGFPRHVIESTRANILIQSLCWLELLSNGNLQWIQTYAVHEQVRYLLMNGMGLAPGCLRVRLWTFGIEPSPFRPNTLAMDHAIVYLPSPPFSSHHTSWFLCLVFTSKEPSSVLPAAGVAKSDPVEWSGLLFLVLLMFLFLCSMCSLWATNQWPAPKKINIVFFIKSLFKTNIYTVCIYMYNITLLFFTYLYKDGWFW